MEGKTTQEQRLDYLVEAFKAESPEYRDLQVPEDAEGKRRLLRSLMNIRDGLSIWQGDITRLAVDAIVNAANSQMLGCFVPMHTCIDNCIHTFAGVQLRAECGRQMELMRRRYGSAYEQPTAVPMLTGA